MSGAARIHMQHFQVGRIHAPAAVMLQQLRSVGAGTVPTVSSTLFKNPALLLRALEAAQRSTAFAAITPLAARLEHLDRDWLESLVRKSALQLALQDTNNPGFLLRHWYLTRCTMLIATALASEAGYADKDSACACAALLRAGMLVLEQQQSSAYALLTAGPWQQQPLLAAERAQFQLDHVEAVLRLAEGWKLDQFALDALRYQALPLAQVLDAAPLVKICWYANALAEDPTPELLRAGNSLLNLDGRQVRAALESAQSTLAAECAALGITYPQQAMPDAAECAHDAQQQLLQLRQEVSLDNMLTQHAVNKGDTPLDVQLARLLQDAGIDPVFIVLAGHADKALEVMASHRVQPEPGGLRVVCAAGRNALSTIVLSAEPGTWTAATPDLTVADRQLLALLGGQTVLCEPLHEGTRTVVLLLGMPASAVSSYLVQHRLRRLVSRTLLATQKATVSGSDALLLQQRIREAVHEANNPLAIIKNYLYVLGMKQGGGQLSEEIQLIRGEIDRVAAILADLREPKAPATPRKLSLNTVVTTMHRLFAQGFAAEDSGIAVELELATEVPEVLASEDALRQILVNLVRNAAEALADTGGTITLGTRTRIYLHDRFYAQLSVRDNGPGIAHDLMLTLFKPGASTKGGAHAGSGLGIVRRLVEDMGGQIGCRSDSNGTAMEILIPLDE